MEFKSLNELMNYYKQKVQEKVLASIEPHQLHSISNLEDQSNVKFFWEQIKDYPKRGGKYIRSILICFTCEALGGDLRQAIPTAAAMELSQNWVLIHDDIEDSSNMRRGKEALHLIYGVNQSINAGDALHMIQWRVLNENLDLFSSVDKIKLVFDEFYSMLMRTALGQTAEMSKRNSFDLTDDDVNYILDGKTGYYTIAGPMRLGAILADKNPMKDGDLFQKIDEFGLALGRAFQIIDDVLDVTSDFEGLKEKGNDIQEGKRSLLFVRLLNKLSIDDKATFIDIMKKEIGTRSKEEIQKVIDWMNSYGVIEEVKKEAYEFAEQSKRILNELPFSARDKKLYAELVNFLVNRAY
jgi:geranylgeranyl diphosphate synthase type II